MNDEPEEMVKRINAMLAHMAATTRLKDWEKHDTLCLGRLRDTWCWCGATDLRRSIRRWEETR